MEQIYDLSKYPYTLDDLLIEAVRNKASDLHFLAKLPPHLRINGDLIPMDCPVLEVDDVKDLVYSVLNEKQIAELEENWELDFSYSIKDTARFRGNIMVQRGTYSAVFRVVPFSVPKLEALNAPKDLERLCTLNRGLILVTGPTGSGKSTTVAAMIDRINKTKHYNIITIEDPIEFLHNHQKSIICQREIGSDTHSFEKSLRQALRHDPDVIMVGEMRDYESISIALTAAETGHLVISTLHTQTAPQTISRIVDSYPSEKRDEVRKQLSSTLRAVVSQQLLPATDGGRVLAAEYMIDSPAVCAMIREGKEHQLYSVLQTSSESGMITMDQCLAEFYRQGRITYETLMHFCIDAKEVTRLIGKQYF